MKSELVIEFRKVTGDGGRKKDGNRVARTGDFKGEVTFGYCRHRGGKTGVFGDTGWDLGTCHWTGW